MFYFILSSHFLLCKCDGMPCQNYVKCRVDLRGKDDRSLEFPKQSNKEFIATNLAFFIGWWKCWSLGPAGEGSAEQGPVLPALRAGALQIPGLGNSEILQEIVHDTTRKSEKHELKFVQYSNYFVLYLGTPATLHFLSNSVFNLRTFSSGPKSFKSVKRPDTVSDDQMIKLYI